MTLRPWTRPTSGFSIHTPLIIMAKHHFYSFLTSLLFSTLLCTGLHAQEKSVLVERCKALDQTSPIHNIWVDGDNIKWIANGNGLNKVLDLNTVEKVTVPSGTTSLLMIRGGNAQLEWNTQELNSLINNATITCASYNPKTESIWLGTRNAGAFEFTINPLKIVQRFNTENRKLTSNQVNDIFIRQNGTVFIATNDGMLTGSGDKWTLLERYLNFIGVDAYGENLWVLGDNFLWHVDIKGKWNPIAIELRNVEGKMSDIAVDDEGRVWIASNMMTGYDVAAEKYQRFGPGQYFTSQFVNCLDVDKDGSIWTGTNDKGLYLIQWESSLILNITQDAVLDCRSEQPTASLSAKVAGGQPPYAYLWSNGQTTQKISQLDFGEYQLTVTDANGLSKTSRYEIPDPKITATVEMIKPASGSEQSDGSATVNAKGGNRQYMFAWDNGENTQVATRLSPGSHTVTVTDKGGCSTTAVLSVAETLTPVTVSITILEENKCAGTPDGALRAEVKGGKSPYQYSWSTEGGKEATISNLGPGTYTVTVTDAANQSITSSVLLAGPPALNATILLLVPANANASDGQAQAKASGGKGPYTYAWSNGVTTEVNKTLSAGNNTLVVTDANGCTSSASITMSENITTLTASITQTGEIKCNGEGTVGLDIIVSGGKAPYKFNWDLGQKTQSIKDLPAGNYQVTVTDVMGSIVTVNKEVKQPAPVSVTTQSDAAASTNQQDGKGTAKASGGTGNLTYAWDNGENSAKATKLAAGIHTVTVTDEAGCSNTGQVEISENILALQVTVEQTGEVLCAGDATASIQTVVTGGKEPYTYTWNNGSSSSSLSSMKDGLFTLTVTDATGHTATIAITVDAPLPIEVVAKVDASAAVNQSNGRASVTVTGGKEKYSYAWDNGEKNAKAEKLNAGIHRVVVTDANGCTAEASVEITENILPLEVSITQTSTVLCAGQSTARLQGIVKGGKEPYSYAWNNGTRQWSTHTINDLAAGNYTLKVSDVAGNSITSQFQVSEPKPLSLVAENISPASTGNQDGEVTLKVSGGTGPYSIHTSTLPSGSTTLVKDKMPPGQHKLSVIDASGCSAEVIFNIPEAVLPLTATIKETVAVKCAGLAQGSLEASAKGGKPPYLYAWNNGITGAVNVNVGPGQYSLSVKDASGQEAKVDYTLKSPPPHDSRCGESQVGYK